jgi:hypothetical protein
MSSPDLHLRTLFVLDDEGRIVAAREPGAGRGPLFFLTRSSTACAWAVRRDVAPELARQLDLLAQQEPPASDPRAEPVFAERYVSLIEQERHVPIKCSGGPAFVFPDVLAHSGAVLVIDDEQLLAHNFRGWVPGEIAAGRAPVLAVLADGHPVSVCFCARRSEVAAEAGVDTATPYRGRGLAARVTAAWALAVRASGRIPLYSTSWTNEASLAVARKLRLVLYASSWDISD